MLEYSCISALPRPRARASGAAITRKMHASTTMHTSYSKYKKAASALPGAALILLAQHIQLVLAGTSSHADRAKFNIFNFQDNIYFGRLRLESVCVKLYQKSWSFQAQSNVQHHSCNQEAIKAAMSSGKRLAVK